MGFKKRNCKSMLPIQYLLVQLKKKNWGSEVK